MAKVKDEAEFFEGLNQLPSATMVASRGGEIQQESTVTMAKLEFSCSPPKLIRRRSVTTTLSESSPESQSTCTQILDDTQAQHAVKLDEAEDEPLSCIEAYEGEAQLLALVQDDEPFVFHDHPVVLEIAQGP